MWPIWVYMGTAIKMQHCDEGIKLIGPSCKKLEQKWSDGQFSFVFFGKSFVFTKIGGHTTKMVRMSSNVCWWLLRYIHSPEQMSSILAGKRWNPGQVTIHLLLKSYSKDSTGCYRFITSDFQLGTDGDGDDGWFATFLLGDKKSVKLNITMVYMVDYHIVYE